MAIVGYKLVKTKDSSIIAQWGGVWGQHTSIPNPVVLPNGDQICAPQIETEYSGYKLILWEMDEPPQAIPSSVPLWAVRFILIERGLIDQVNQAISESENAAVKIIWEYGNTVDRNSPALLALADAIGITNELDDLFIKAGNLKV